MAGHHKRAGQQFLILFEDRLLLARLARRKLQIGRSIVDMNGSDGRRDLAVRSVVAIMTGGAGLAGPEAGAAATALTPLMEAGLSRIFETLSNRRRLYAAETLLDGADAFGAITDEEFLGFVEQAIADPVRQELLARTLIIAQDAARRDKRRALGRALAAGVEGDGARVDQELLFIRVLDDLDESHTRLLALMNSTPPHLASTGYADARVWMPWSICRADPGLGESVYALLLALQRHGLIWSSGESYHVPGGGMEEEYRITPYGEWFLQRIAGPTSEHDPAT
jgi:hypothetical protein